MDIVVVVLGCMQLEAEMAAPVYAR